MCVWGEGYGKTGLCGAGDVVAHVCNGLSIFYTIASSEELKELAFYKHTNWDDVLQKKVSMWNWCTDKAEILCLQCCVC